MSPNQYIVALHKLFLEYFGGSSSGSIRLHKYNAQYRCPNKNCDTNIIGRHSYGKNKLSVSFDIFKYKCWVCEQFGSVSSIAKDYFDTIDKKFVAEARKELQSYFAISISERGIISNVTIREETKDFLPLISFDDEDEYDIQRNKILRYAFNKRGLTMEHLFYYRLMFTRRGRYSNMLIVPSYDKNNEMNYFIGRSVLENPKYKFGKPSIPKEHIIFNERFIDWNKQLIIVEGPIDYLQLHGFNRTILDGSSIGKESLLLQRLKYHRPIVKLLLDPDALEKTYKISMQLKRFGIANSVVTHKLVERGVEDAGAMRGDERVELIESVLNEPASSSIAESLGQLFELMKK